MKISHNYQIIYIFVIHIYLISIINIQNTISQTPAPSQTDPSCAEIPSILSDRRTNKNRLRIVTYNAEFLFRLNTSCSNPSLECPGINCDWKNNSMSDIHMEKISNVIELIDGDIIILQEVQDCCVVDYFYQNYFNNNMKNLYNYYMIRGIDYYTGQNLLLLTKIDPSSDITRTSESATYPRNDSTCSGTWGDDYQSVSKNMIVNFTNISIGSGSNILLFDLSVIGIHLLAQPTNSDRCGTREAQATVIQDVIRNHIDLSNNINNLNNREYIIMGDFNDYDKQWPDRHDHTPITNVLKYLKESTLYPLNIDDIIGNNNYWGNMTNTAQYINQTWRYTHYPQSGWEEIDGCYSFSSSYTDQYDYILLSNGLKQYIDNVQIGHEYCGTYYSDHLPIIVDLKYEINQPVTTAKTDTTNIPDITDANTIDSTNTPDITDTNTIDTTNTPDTTNIPDGTQGNNDSGVIGNNIFNFVTICPIFGIIVFSKLMN